MSNQQHGAERAAEVDARQHLTEADRAAYEDPRTYADTMSADGTQL